MARSAIFARGDQKAYLLYTCAFITHVWNEGKDLGGLPEKLKAESRVFLRLDGPSVGYLSQKSIGRSRDECVRLVGCGTHTKGAL